MKIKAAKELVASDVVRLSGYRVRVATIIRCQGRVTISGTVGQRQDYIVSVPEDQLFILQSEKSTQ